MRSIFSILFIILSSQLTCAMVQQLPLPAASVRAVAVDSDQSVFYIGTYGGGVYRSINNGSDWIKCSDTGLSPFVNALWVCCNGNLLAATETGAVLSDNQGNSWSVLTNMKCLDILAVDLDNSGEETILAGTEGAGLLMKRPGDAQFIPATAGTGVFRVKAISVDSTVPEGKIFIGTEKGVLVSEDSGATWTTRNSGLQHLPVNALTISEDASRLFVITQRDPTPISTDGAVYVSEDAGMHWTKVFDNDPCFTDVTIDPDNPDTVAICTYYSGVLISRNSGAVNTWRSANIGLASRRAYCLLFDSGILYSGTSAGFCQKNSDDTWIVKNNGLFAANVRAVLPASDDGNRWFVGCDEQGVYKTEDKGLTWTRVMNGFASTHLDVISLEVDPFHPDTIYAGLKGYFIYRSTNSGASWSRLQTPGGGNNWIYAMDITADPHVPQQVYCSAFDRGLLKSQDGGTSWTYINGDLSWISCAAMKPVPGNSSRFLVGMLDGDIFRTTDGGTTYTKTSVNSLIWLRTSVFDIVFTNTDNAVISTDRGIYFSSDQGEHFSQTTPDFAVHPFFCLAQATGNPNIIYAGGALSTVLRSDNGGTSWVRLTDSTQLPTGSIYSLAIDPTDTNSIFAGIDGAGLYRLY